jgi:electron transport complex protein RnfG
MHSLVDKTLRLTLICGVAAFLLGLVNYKTEPVIRERKAIELSALVSGAEAGAPVDVEDEVVNLYYPVSVADETLYILSLTGKGYGGDMTLLAVYDSQGELINAKLMDNDETIGIGKKAEDSTYMDKFLNRGVERPLPTTKAMIGSEFDDVTGATITFSGVSQALYQGSEWIKEGSF